MLAVVRNLMLNASWNYAIKIHSFKILNKNIKKKQEEHNFSKKFGLLPGHLYICMNTMIVCL